MSQHSDHRVAAIDCLRGVAILLVITWHYAQNTTLPLFLTGHPLPQHLLIYAWSGVDLFFVLSGLLIGGILMDQRATPAYFRTFYIRRGLRILPLYAVTLALYIAELALLTPLPGTAFGWLFGDPLPTLSYLTFTQNFAMAAENRFGAHWVAVTWSLAVEEQFYLLLPLLIRFVPRDRLPQVLIAGIVAAPFIRAALAASVASVIPPYVLLPARMDALLLGVLIADRLRLPGHGALLERHRRWLWVASGVALAVILALALRREQIGGRWMNWFGYSAFAVFYAAVVTLVMLRAGSAIFAGRTLAPLRAAGLGCFSLYLFHQPVLGLLLSQAGGAPRVTGWHDVAALGIACAALCAIAWASWRCVEQPAHRYGRRFRYGP